MMTRKDFELIAAVLKREKPLESWSPNKMVQWQLIVHGLISALAQTNPRFDALRFSKACGGSAEDEMASHSADH